MTHLVDCRLVRHVASGSDSTHSEGLAIQGFMHGTCPGTASGAVTRRPQPHPGLHCNDVQSRPSNCADLLYSTKQT